jgi:phytanoyl-CoA hydroxylase
MRARTVVDGVDDGHIRVALHLCHISDLFRVQALDARVMSMVRRIFGTEAVVLTSLLFNKPAQVGEAVNLHQDLPYYPYLGDDDLVTCWTALDDVDSGNGCLEYLPGSHRSRITHRRTGAQQRLKIEPADVDVARLVPMPLKAGEGVVHHGLTVHRSAANRSGRPRLGMATLYVRASAPVSLEDFPYPVLAPSSAVSR